MKFAKAGSTPSAQGIPSKAAKAPPRQSVNMQLPIRTQPPSWLPSASTSSNWPSGKPSVARSVRDPAVMRAVGKSSIRRDVGDPVVPPTRSILATLCPVAAVRVVPVVRAVHAAILANAHHHHLPHQQHQCVHPLLPPPPPPPHQARQVVTTEIVLVTSNPVLQPLAVSASKSTTKAVVIGTWNATSATLRVTSTSIGSPIGLGITRGMPGDHGRSPPDARRGNVGPSTSFGKYFHVCYINCNSSTYLLHI